MSIGSDAAFSPEDPDAAAYYRETDDNDQTCAILKVTLTNPVSGQLVADPRGGYQTVKTEKRETGEWWFWFSPTVKSVRFTCEGYTPTDYVGLTLEEAKVYRLTLNVASSVRQIQDFTLQQNLMKLNISPQNVTVSYGKTQKYEIDTKYITDGHFDEFLDAGTYYYKIESQFYQTLTGKYVLGPDSKEENISLKPNFGTVSITSIPEGANVIIDGAPVGNTPVASSGKLTPGNHTVRLNLADYYSEEFQFSVKAGESLKLQAVSLRPQFGNVVCLCDDKEATLTVTDPAGTVVARGRSGLKVKLNSRNTYKLESSKASHVSQSVGIVGNTLEGKSINVTVGAPIPLYGAIQFTSTPTRAEVYLDGSLIGTTSCQQKVLVGDHNIEIRMSGYQSAVEKVNVAQNQTVRINKTLIKGPKEVDVTIATASGCKLYKDGKLLSENSVWSGKLDTGKEYLFESEKTIDPQKYKRGQARITITADAGKRYNVPAPTLKVGTLSVTSGKQSGASVQVSSSSGSSASGVTPFMKSLEEGDYNVSVSKHGYYKESRNGVYVRDGQNTTLDIPLRKIPWLKREEEGFASFFMDAIMAPPLLSDAIGFGLNVAGISTHKGYYGQFLAINGSSGTSYTGTGGLVLRLTGDNKRHDLQLYGGIGARYGITNVYEYYDYFGSTVETASLWNDAYDYGYVGYNTKKSKGFKFAAEAGVRLGWRQNGSFGKWDLLAGAQYVNGSITPVAGMSIVIPSVPIWGPFYLLGAGLVSYLDYIAGAEMIHDFDFLGIFDTSSASEGFIGLGYNFAPEEEVLGGYINAAIGVGDSGGFIITAGPEASFMGELGRFDLYGGLGYVGHTFGFDVGIRAGVNFGLGMIGMDVPIGLMINVDGSTYLYFGYGLYF